MIFHLAEHISCFADPVTNVDLSSLYRQLYGEFLLLQIIFKIGNNRIFFKFLYIVKCIYWQSFSFIFQYLGELQPYKVVTASNNNAIDLYSAYNRGNKLQALTKTVVTCEQVEVCTAEFTAITDP